MNISLRFRVLVLLFLAFAPCANAVDARNARVATPTPGDELSSLPELPPLDIGILPRLPAPDLAQTPNDARPNIIAANDGVPTALPAATLARLNTLLASPEMADAHVGVCIRGLGKVENAADFPSKPYADKSQPMLFSSDGDKRFLPASNMKLFTAALALGTLGSEKTFETRVFTQSSTRFEEGATLYIVGGGDPSLAIDDLRQLARAVRQSGIVKVDKIVADNSFFQAETNGNRYPDGWTLDDATWYYGMEVSALALERNQVDITISGTRKGRAAKIEVDPVLPGFAVGDGIFADVKTGGRELKNMEESELVQFERGDADNALGAKLSVRGKIAPGQVISDGVAVPNVARVVARVFAAQLRTQGVRVGEKTEVGVAPTAKIKIVAQHDSAPLRVLIQRFLKKSDNLYGEMLLRAVGALSGESTGSKSGNTSGESSGTGISSTGMAARGHNALMNWLRRTDVPTAGLRLSDGSGLSRYNLLSPRAVVALLAEVEKLKGSRALYDALPIAAVDGTLKKRMANTRAANNVRAKTGTFSVASCLSGYVTTRDGHRLAVSILTNFARDGDQARALQNSVFAALADAHWNASPK